MPKPTKFRRSKIGIKRMLAKCAPVGKSSLKLPPIFEQLFAIQKKQKHSDPIV